jgi:hypothetical protein
MIGIVKNRQGAPFALVGFEKVASAEGEITCAVLRRFQYGPDDASDDTEYVPVDIFEENFAVERPAPHSAPLLRLVSRARSIYFTARRNEAVWSDYGWHEIHFIQFNFDGKGAALAICYGDDMETHISSYSGVDLEILLGWDEREPRDTLSEFVARLPQPPHNRHEELDGESRRLVDSIVNGIASGKELPLRDKVRDLLVFASQEVDMLNLKGLRRIQEEDHQEHERATEGSE